uniref:Uncharacterized protein n=1 Tax=Octopus bimaculoides TaxID=37653 RepID=A0A0L8G5D1_OCTBM
MLLNIFNISHYPWWSNCFPHLHILPQSITFSIITIKFSGCSLYCVCVIVLSLSLPNSFSNPLKYFYASFFASVNANVL